MTFEDKNKKIRLFLGSFVDIEAFYDYQNIHTGLKNHFDCHVKFVEKQNMHLTWKFIGETKNSFIPEFIGLIEKAVSEISDITVNFDKFQLWPDSRYPRQLVITGQDTNGNAAGLYNRLNSGLKEVKKEKRKFNPHITIARFRQKPANKISLPEWLELKERKIHFKSMELIKSRLTPNGSVYEKVKVFEL